MKFQVIFQQVNQVAIEVEAINEASAGDKAAREWRREYGQPTELQIAALVERGEVES